MRKKIFVLSASLLALVAIGSWHSQGNAENGLQAPEDELVIEGKKPARFSHPVHLGLGLECGACHHDDQHEPLNAEAIAALDDPSTLSCVSCHDSSHPVEDLQKAKDVFHAQCRTCHKDGYAGKNGPTKCTDCHIKTKTRALEGC
jgi:hypothetical protein